MIAGERPAEMTSKRRKRRIHGKMRAATVAKSIQIPDAEYGSESLAGLADLIPPANDRRSFSTLELSEEQVEAIKNTKMDPRHDHLNALLEDDFGHRRVAQKGSIPPNVDLEI
ncbi:MAG: hypothetical protein P4M13_08570 [Alphaproteobacteria bacterium]|nr:hypothetical protein [Alphaproteobacteria bacterium]